METELTHEVAVNNSNPHHTLRMYQAGGYSTVKVCGMMTGCGLVQLYGASVLNQKTLDDVIKDVRGQGAGAIICTLGQSYFQYEKNVLELGFTLLKEYNNYLHGATGNYKQRLYIYETN